MYEIYSFELEGDKIYYWALEGGGGYWANRSSMLPEDFNDWRDSTLEQEKAFYPDEEVTFIGKVSTREEGDHLIQTNNLIS